jgi:DNA-binding transcriptional LysR family regulator
MYRPLPVDPLGCGCKMHRMNNWDDIRYFLAVIRSGSVRAAADALGVNHATVIRRIVQLEKVLGSKVFDKLPSGYRLTPAGAEIVDLAEQMEAKSDELKSRIFGRDQGLRGKLRVTLAPSLASGLLMPDFATFSATHSEIELEVIASQGPVNLVKREADVALRVIYETSSPPPHLNGLRLQDVHGAAYAARTLLQESGAQPGRPLKWLLRAGDWPPPAVRTSKRFARRPCRRAFRTPWRKPPRLEPEAFTSPLGITVMRGMSIVLRAATGCPIVGKCASRHRNASVIQASVHKRDIGNESHGCGGDWG